MSDLSSYLNQQRSNKPSTFSVRDIEGFPYSEFSRLQSLYTEAESWYDGTALDETIETINGQEVERYPVKINPIKGVVLKHVKSLFGEILQDEKPLVFPRVVPYKDSQKDLADEAENVLSQIWWESSGRAMQSQAGFHTQIYGGCAWSIGFDPLDPTRSTPLKFELIHPRSFVGKPYSTNPWRLKEAWIVRVITKEEALENGVSVEDDDLAWLVEKYTESEYVVTVNGSPCSRKGVPLSGKNQWGFIPIVYIPAIRSHDFYGETFVGNVKGIILEYNRRFADYGDAVAVDSHSYLGMRNVNGAPAVQQIAPGLYVVNVGSNPNITGSEKDPDIFELRKPSASAPMGDLLDQLYAQFRRDAFIPPIADGEDEGSQRSGLTLAMRMWPLITYTDMQRINWTTGLDTLSVYALKMLAITGAGGITPAHTVMRIRQEWAPVLPRDREAEINEAATRVESGLASRETMMEKLGDIEDPEEELKQILKYEEDKAKIAAKANPPPAQGMPGAKPPGSNKPKPKAEPKPKEKAE